MAASTNMTNRAQRDVKDGLDRITTDTKRELEIINGIKLGLAEAEAGQVIPHTQAVAEMREIIEDAKRRKAEGG